MPVRSASRAISFALTDRARSITPTGFAWQSARDLRISFPLQSAVGQYELVLAPSIASVGGFCSQPRQGRYAREKRWTISNVATFTLISATDLGTVLYEEVPGVNLSQGVLAYLFAATHSGTMTIIGTPSGPGTLLLQFHDETTGEDVASTLVDGSQRIDVPLQANGQGLLYVSGTATDVDLKLANLVQRDGTTVTVYGTDDADDFVLDASSGFGVSIKGVPYHFGASEVSLIAFDGGPGDDTATLTGTSGSEHALLYPDHGEVSGAGWKATVAGVVSTEVIGGGGYDVTQMYDSPGNDHYESALGLSTLTGPGFSLTSRGFAETHGYGREGGVDTAAIHSPEHERVKFKADAKAGWSKIYTPWHDAEYPLFYSRAKFFEVVNVYNHADFGYARFFDSKGDDTFTGQKDESRHGRSRVRRHRPRFQSTDRLQHCGA